MSGDTAIDDLEVSDGASENDSSDHDHEPDVLEREEGENTDMAEQKFRPDVDENGKAGGGSAVTTSKPKLDPKDPLRPRRKKARRACFACQRAHLTCGMFVSSVGGGFGSNCLDPLTQRRPHRNAVLTDAKSADDDFR